MNVWEIVLGIVLLIVCLILVLLIMLQEGNSRGMGGVAPEVSNESYLGNNKGRTFDAILARFTKVSAVLFFVLTIAISLISVLNK